MALTRRSGQRFQASIWPGFVDAMTALLLIAGVTAVTVALAASASLAANGQVIDVLRLVGAEDAYITRAFVRRFTLRALIGGAGGTLLGLLAVALIPNVDASGIGGDIGLSPDCRPRRRSERPRQLGDQ